MRLAAILKDVGLSASPRIWRPFRKYLLARPLRAFACQRRFTNAPLFYQENAPQKVELRPYQKASIDAVLEYLARGEKRLGLSLATGSGKTVIFSHLIDEVRSPLPDATQTLILAHRKELVEQAAKHCRNLYPEKTVDIEMASQHASGLADITVASVQSITSGDRLMRYDPAKFKLIIVDEAHHIVARRHLDVLRHFKLTDKDDLGAAALVGVSATFSRHDGVGLNAAIDHIVYHKDYVDMIEGNHLAGVIFTSVRSGVDLSNVKSRAGDFRTKELAEAVNKDEINTITVRAWLEKAASRKSTLVFCVDLAHVASLTAAFRQHGIDARFVTSDTHAKVRTERLDAFKAGKYPVLLNCGIFTEGTDIPNIDCIILARPTQSRNLLVQMIGRGLRKYPGKENCHVIDMVTSLEVGIVTTPTLFGLEAGTLLEAADPRHMASIRERREIERQREVEALAPPSQTGLAQVMTGQVTFTDYDNINDLIGDSTGERHIRAISQLAWVQIDESRYMVCNRDGAFLTIVKNEDSSQYTVMYTARLPSEATSKSPFARPRQVGKSPQFEHAVHAADTFAMTIFPLHFVSKSAPWRKGPASEKQLAFLNRSRQEGEKLRVGDLTMGRAADQITKIRHGARGRLNRIQGERKKLGREAARREKWQRRFNPQVKAGPVLGNVR
ncbi:related to 51.5 kDa protein [Ramularia collo-cygni]|uniref:Related to 51.5 kDa protein n=1 Tax=Ramularia collo-cygni TaxID=112498 RepID=A0A2D3UWJ1_9PEZI|nr:related to 51.5 kDa protein [Ramularia collo-cygni]CZT19748.1 related to 51.5 kDa protein [Ramularia collo-cygni]